MLSEKDEELLSILRCNSRASVSDIARALNLSRTTVQNRIAKLESTQVIKSYGIELGTGYEDQLVSAHVSLKVKPKLRHNVSSALRKISQISQHYSISGEYDLLAIVQAGLTDPKWLGYSVEGYAFVALMFWIFCFGMSKYSQHLERHFHTGHGSR